MQVKDNSSQMFQSGLSTLFFQKIVISSHQYFPKKINYNKIQIYCYDENFLCQVLLPYLKHLYFSSGLDYKSKQISQINEVKMKLSIPLILHIISVFWLCRCFFIFLPMGDRNKTMIWNPPWYNNPDFPFQLLCSCTIFSSDIHQLNSCPYR